MTKITYIPGEIANAAIDEHGNRKPVTRTQHIFDDNLEKPQNEVNQDRIEDVATLDGKIALEKQRAEGVESGLNNRLGTVEQLAEISIGGGDAQIATGADFTNPDATKRAKVPTVGAIIDGLNDGVYDVSKRNPSGGPNSDGKFTLEYILSNANTLIPTSWRHGGMSISFVSTYDNKYIQARCMAQNFTTDVTQWQGVDDEPTAGSDNLVKSGGVYRAIEDSTEELYQYSGRRKYKVDVKAATYRYIYLDIKAGINYYFTCSIASAITNKLNFEICDSSGTKKSSGSGWGINVGDTSFTKQFSINEDLTGGYIRLWSSSVDVPNVNITIISDEGNSLSNVKSWILSESFIPSTITRDSYGNISSIVGTWPDGIAGTLTFTRDANGNVTQVNALRTNIGRIYLNITRDSYGRVTSASFA